MKKYVENVSIENFEEVNLKIDNWKKEIIVEVKSKINPWRKWISIFSGILFIVFATISTLSVYDENYTYIWFFYIVISFFVSVIFVFLHYLHIHKVFSSVMDSKDINPYTSWLHDINSNIKEENNVYEYSWNESKYDDYLHLKYKLTGWNSVGLTKEYNIFKGVIFNNPYNLSCGIWKSETKIRDSTQTYDDYLPLVKVKTNLFSGEQINITNSTKFHGFSKKDIKLENDAFNKKFSVLSTNESVARMILTPLIQEKWLKMNNLPEFNMELKNGYINVLFWVQRDFMDIDALSFKSFSKINTKIWSDINKFLSILTLIFSVSIFQFEESK